MSDIGQTNNGFDPATINGLFALGGVVLGSIVTILKDIILRKLPIQLEKVRIHDKNRIEAYKELIVFTKELQNSSFPLAENKKADFRKLMKARYEDKILRNLPYYNKYIIERLEKLENNYTCMTHPDLIPEVDCTEFIEKELFKTVNEMNKEIKKILKSWN